MKKFKSSIVYNSGFNLRIDLGYGIFSALSLTNALIYNKETEKVHDCLWEIDNNGLLIISYGIKGLTYFMLLSETDTSLFVQELEKKTNGKFTKKEKKEWTIILPENIDLIESIDIDDTKSIKERINPIICLTMALFYFIQLIFVIIINNIFENISISSEFIVILSSIVYIAMIKTNFTLAETFYARFIKKYLN